jgi:hypothetical protein
MPALNMSKFTDVASGFLLILHGSRQQILDLHPFCFRNAQLESSEQLCIWRGALVEVLR